MNKKVLEALIKSGAFDGLHPAVNRAAMLAALEGAVDEAQKVGARARERTDQPVRVLRARRRRKRQSAAHLQRIRLSTIRIAKERLASRKRGAGILHHRPSARSLSGGPEAIRRHAHRRRAGARAIGKRCRSAGIVTGYKEWPLKSGDGRMAVFIARRHRRLGQGRLLFQSVRRSRDGAQSRMSRCSSSAK